jgi:hypothetical protein
LTINPALKYASSIIFGYLAINSSINF